MSIREALESLPRSKKSDTRRKGISGVLSDVVDDSVEDPRALSARIKHMAHADEYTDPTFDLGEYMDRLDEANKSDTLQLLAGTRKRNEASKAVIACNDYLRAGPARTVASVLRRYREVARQRGRMSVPTCSKKCIYQWCWDFGWYERAEQYDALTEHDKNDQAREVMNTGLALPYRRVGALKQLAMRLMEELSADDALWLKDVKMIGRGKLAEFIEIKRFNAALIDQFRGVLDDLAQETGGRQKTQRNLNMNLEELTDEQLEMIAQGKDPFTGMVPHAGV